MNHTLILLGSPRQGGVSDTLAHAFAEGLAQSGHNATMLALRQFAIRPCMACSACKQPPHACTLAPGDDAEQLFGHILGARHVLVAAPVHFYALPAHFKALIDRAQRFWQAGMVKSDGKALALLTAGRKNGEQIFNGSLLTLRYFFAALGKELVQQQTFRAVDNVQDITADHLMQARQWGQAWGLHTDALTGKE